MSRPLGLWSLGFIGIETRSCSLPCRYASGGWDQLLSHGWEVCTQDSLPSTRPRWNAGSVVRFADSNVPFYAMLSGKRGSVSQAFSDLADEINIECLMAAGVSTVWVLSRGRVKSQPN
jgi:hypothetical protein